MFEVPGVTMSPVDSGGGSPAKIGKFKENYFHKLSKVNSICDFPQARIYLHTRYKFLLVENRKWNLLNCMQEMCILVLPISGAERSHCNL